MFDAQILKVREWRFAEHGVAAALQGAGAGSDGLGSALEREASLEVASSPAFELQDEGIGMGEMIGDDVWRLRVAQVGGEVVRDGACEFGAGLADEPEREVEVTEGCAGGDSDIAGHDHARFVELDARKALSKEG